MSRPAPPMAAEPGGSPRAAHMTHVRSVANAHTRRPMRAVTELDLVRCGRPAGAYLAREITAGSIAHQGHQDEKDAGEKPERQITQFSRQVGDVELTQRADGRGKRVEDSRDGGSRDATAITGPQWIYDRCKTGLATGPSATDAAGTTGSSVGDMAESFGARSLAARISASRKLTGSPGSPRSSPRDRLFRDGRLRRWFMLAETPARQQQPAIRGGMFQRSFFIGLTRR